jgi:hypothetical protein
MGKLDDPDILSHSATRVADALLLRIATRVASKRGHVARLTPTEVYQELCDPKTLADLTDIIDGMEAAGHPMRSSNLENSEFDQRWWRDMIEIFPGGDPSR